MKNLTDEISLRKNTGTLDFEPVFYDLSKTADQLNLKELLRNNPEIEIVDTINAQLSELIASRNPSQKLKKDQLDEQIHEKTNGNSASYGRWVYYSWLRKIIHLLGPDEFIELRTNRNRNKITKEEHHLLSQKIVGVVGLSVGKTISVTMAMERSFGEIRIADHDTLDLSNLNRLQTGVQSLGLPKTVIAAREIYEIDPYLKVKCYHDGLTEENLDSFFTEKGNLDLIVDECDGLDIKILLRFKARKLGIPVLMDMNDRGTLDVERFDLEPDRPILHGMIDHLDLNKIKGLSNVEKIPYILPMLGEKTISPKLKASMLEMGFSLSTWPQLSSSVMLGGAIAADTYRRIMLNQFQQSGRYWVDPEEIITDKVSALREIDSNVALNFSNGFNKMPALKAQIISAPILDKVRKWDLNLSEKLLTVDFKKIDPTSDFDYSLVDCLNAGITIAELEKWQGRKFDLVSINKNQFKVKIPALIKTDKTSSTSNDTNKAVGIEEFAEKFKELQLKGRFIQKPDEIRKFATIISEAEKFRHLHPFWSQFYLNQVLSFDKDEDESGYNGLFDDYEKAFIGLSNDEEVIGLLNKWNGGEVFKLMSLKRLLRSEAFVIITENTHNQENIFNLGKKLADLKSLVANSNFSWMNLLSIPLMKYNDLGGSIVEKCEVSLENKSNLNFTKSENFAFIGGIFVKNESIK